MYQTLKPMHQTLKPMQFILCCTQLYTVALHTMGRGGPDRGAGRKKSFKVCPCARCKCTGPPREAGYLRKHKQRFSVWAGLPAWEQEQRNLTLGVQPTDMDVDANHGDEDADMEDHLNARLDEILQHHGGPEEADGEGEGGVGEGGEGEDGFRVYEGYGEEAAELRERVEEMKEGVSRLVSTMEPRTTEQMTSLLAFVESQNIASCEVGTSTGFRHGHFGAMANVHKDTVRKAFGERAAGWIDDSWQSFETRCAKL